MKSSATRLELISLLAGALLACAGLSYSAPETSRHPKRLLGIEGLSRLELMPLMKRSLGVGCISSYDRTGGNDDGFSGAYSFIRKEPGGLVLADLKGPGVIYRIHTPTPTEDIIEFYFDGEHTPRISAELTHLFDGSKPPFEPPLVGFGAGGYFCYVPIAFQKSCKVLVKAEKFRFYQINYAVYPKDLLIPTYQDPPTKEFLSGLEEAAKVLNSTGSDISARLVPEGTKVETQTFRGLLNPGGKLTLFETAVPGRIVGLKLGPAEGFAGKNKDILIKMFWDEASEPAIVCPVGDFFGYSFGEPAVKSLFLGTSGGENYIYIPMPYERSARIELVSERASGPGLEVCAEVKIAGLGKMREEGRFYALWQRENPTRTEVPYTYLKAAGRGHVIGVILQAQGILSGNTSFFEGDDCAIIDGNLAIPGTGSEDSFNGGYYDIPGRWDERVSLPLSGCLDYKKPLGRTGGYRWMITDAYAYTKSIEFTIEHGPEGNRDATDYTSVAFFYSLNPPVWDKSILPAAERRIADPETIVFSPGWNVPINTFTPRDTALSKNAVTFGEERYRLLSLIAPIPAASEPVFSLHVSFIFDIPVYGRYDVKLKALLGPDEGIVRMFRHGRPVGEPLNLYAAERSMSPTLFLGTLDMLEGNNVVSINVVGKDERSQGVRLDLFQVIFERRK